jgi:hypothetical protein
MDDNRLQGLLCILCTLYSVQVEYESNPSRIFFAGFSTLCKPYTVRKISIEEYLLANAAHEVTFAAAYPILAICNRK